MNQTKNSIRPLTDLCVRKALRKKVLKRYYDIPRALILEEVGIRHGTARIDLLVLNGCLHGFELKSEQDNLGRLQHQARVYSTVLDRITLVVSHTHAGAAIPMIPNWWGVKVVTQGKRGAIHFETVRYSKVNSEVQKHALAKFLWRDEAIAVLEELGVDLGVRSKTRREIYERLAQSADLTFIRGKVYHFLNLRKGLGTGAQRMSDGG